MMRRAYYQDLFPLITASLDEVASIAEGWRHDMHPMQRAVRSQPHCRVELLLTDAGYGKPG